jgi:light-regulated signal transduction histidine kinase (bacteriophytochrome)
VAELAALRVAQSDLKRSNAELEQFAYVASHDLQEPLRKVASFCQLLERRYKGQLDERGDQYIEYAVDGAKRMQQLINDLLAFSRVGRIAAEFAPVDLGAALAQAQRQLATMLDETGATVTSDDLPTINGTSSLLVQLFQNLVGNALKFHGAESPRIHIGVRAAGGMWELSCSDNGIGIGEQYADKIFVIFQRLHARDAYGGTGIGLSMCRKIVEYHGGRIWLDTNQTSGAVLRWTLPVAGGLDVAATVPDHDERSRDDAVSATATD